MEIGGYQIYSWAEEKYDLFGQLDSTGYAAEFGKGSWKIVKGAMVVARGTKFGTLYTTTGGINMLMLLKVLPIHICGTTDLDT